MKVLLARHWTNDGVRAEELVWLPPGSGAVGLRSGVRRLEVEVAELPMAVDAWSVLVADALSAGCWLPDEGWSAECDDVLEEALATIETIVADFSVGTPLTVLADGSAHEAFRALAA